MPSISSSIAVIPGLVGYELDEHLVVAAVRDDSIICTATFGLAEVADLGAGPATRHVHDVVGPADSLTAMFWTNNDNLADRLATDIPTRVTAMQVKDGHWRELPSTDWQPVDGFSATVTTAVLHGVNLATPTRDQIVAKWATRPDLARQVAAIQPNVEPISNKRETLDDLWAGLLAGNTDPAFLATLYTQITNYYWLRDAIIVRLGDEFGVLTATLATVAAAAPQEAIADTAAMIAGAAYLAGNELVAGILVDRAHEANPDHKLTNLFRTAKAATGSVTPIFRETMGALSEADILGH
jgi:hypothetical protein